MVVQAKHLGDNTLALMECWIRINNDCGTGAVTIPLRSKRSTRHTINYANVATPESEI